MVSSLDKYNSTSFSKYDSVYRTNSAASLLQKSQKYQEENKMPPSPFRWLTTAVTVFSLFYTYKKPTLYTEHQQSSHLVHALLVMHMQITEWGFPRCVSLLGTTL